MLHRFLGKCFSNRKHIYIYIYDLSSFEVQRQPADDGHAMCNSIRGQHQQRVHELPGIVQTLESKSWPLLVILLYLQLLFLIVAEFYSGTSKSSNDLVIFCPRTSVKLPDLFRAPETSRLTI